MLQMVFQGGDTIPYLEAVETEGYHSGASRRILTVTALPQAISSEKLSTLMTAEGLKGLRLQNTDTGEETAYTDYTMVLSYGVQRLCTRQEDPEQAAVFENRLVIQLGRPTFLEAQLARLGIAR